MNAIGKNGILIQDSEVYEAGEKIRRDCCLINDVLTQYNTCLNKIANNAILSGEVKDALIAYIEFTSKLINVADYVGNKSKRLSIQFIDLIDTQDSFLYEKGGEVIRDFSDAEYAALKRLFDSGNINFTGGVFDRFGDWIIGKMLEFGCFDVTKVGVNLDWAHQALLDYNDSTWSDIEQIFEWVRGTDTTYGNSTQMGDGSGRLYRVGYFNAMVYVIWEIRLIVEKMIEIISPKNGRFNVNTINLELTQMFADLEKDLETAVQVKESGNDVSEIQISDFIENWKHVSFFNDYDQLFSEFFQDNDSLGQTASILVFNGVEIGTESLIKMFTVPDDVKFEDVYAYLMYKKHIAETIDDIVGKENLEVFDSYEKASEIVDAFLKGASFVDLGIPEEYKEILDEINKHLKDGKELMDAGTELSKLMIGILANYMEGEAILTSVTAELPEGSLTQIAARELMFEYEHKFLAEIETTVNFVVEFAIEELLDENIDLVLKLAGDNASGLYSISKLAIDTIGGLSGLGTSSNAFYDFTILKTELYDIRTAYQNNFDIVKNGDFSEVAITNLKNSFLMMKNLYVKMLDYMSLYSSETQDWNKKSYYNYLSMKLQMADMSWDGNGFISYEDYNKYVKN